MYPCGDVRWLWDPRGDDGQGVLQRGTAARSRLRGAPGDSVVPGKAEAAALRCC